MGFDAIHTSTWARPPPSHFLSLTKRKKKEQNNEVKKYRILDCEDSCNVYFSSLFFLCCDVCFPESGEVVCSPRWTEMRGNHRALRKLLAPIRTVFTVAARHNVSTKSRWSGCNKLALTDSLISPFFLFISTRLSYFKCLTDGVNPQTASTHHSKKCTYFHILATESDIWFFAFRVETYMGGGGKHWKYNHFYWPTNALKCIKLNRLKFTWISILKGN